jgi:hypothetical protein
MHVNRGLLGWGVFFIALGSVPLAVQGGVLDAATARRAWELWPLLLIGAGLGLALRNTPLSSLGNVVVGLTFGLMGGGLVVGGLGSAPIAFCGTGSGSTDTANAPATTGTLRDGSTVDLSVDCGTLTVSGQPGSDWSLEWPAGSSNPQVDASPGRHLEVRMGNDHEFGVSNRDSRWTLVLPNDPATNVSLDVNAGSARVALGGAHITSLDATVNAGDARIDLSGAVSTQSLNGSVNAGSLSVALPTPDATLSGSFSANAGSVRLCTPTGVPLRIRVGDEPLGSNNFAARGLTQNGNTWTRGVYGLGTAQIDLTVSANLGSITLDPEDGCG